MKRIINLLVVSFLVILSHSMAQGQNLETPQSKTTVKWITNDTIDMGQLKLNNPTKVVFKFKNSGNAPLIINNAKGTCGCTNVNWTKEPIKPGDEGFVEATYNAASLGNFLKTVFVKWNAEPETVTLVLKGTVVQ